MTEVNTNVMGTPSLMGDEGVSSLGKVALSLLPGKDSLTSEDNTLYSGLGHAATLDSLHPETVQIKREDWDDQKKIDMEHGDCSEEGDFEMDSDDEVSSRGSWKERVEKPDIVKNLVGQRKEVTLIDSYPRSTLKVLKAVRLKPGCGDPLVEANLLSGGHYSAHLNSIYVE